MKMRLVTAFTLLLTATSGAFAVCGPGPGTTPADPTNRDNQMITDCMSQQDPAMNKDDALELCKKKFKQGIDLDKPKKKQKPVEGNAKPVNPPKPPSNSGQ